MKRYLKLVNFEFNRFAKMYLLLLGITLVLQVVGVIVTSINYMKGANRIIEEKMISKEQFLSQYGAMNFEAFLRNQWFIIPIVVGIVVMVIYVFMIWYRDWFGKSTFIYRQLMLPISRLTIFLAKASTIFLSVLGLIAFQVILLPVELGIFKGLVPSDFRSGLVGVTEITQNVPYVNVLIPTSFTQFVLTYFSGIMLVFIVFTAILLERSFRLKGIGLALLYVAIIMTVILSPIFFVGLNYFYPIELLTIELFLELIVLVVSIGISSFLLKWKISV